MITAYSVTVTEDGKEIFAKDEEYVSYAHASLVHIIQTSNLIPDPMDDMTADHYATYLKSICLKEYAAAFGKEVAVSGQI